jgi:hypothetical protein
MCMLSFLLSGGKRFSRHAGALRFEHECDGCRAKAHGTTLPSGNPAGESADAGRER